MHQEWTKSPRFSAVMNGVFIGVGVIFLIWGATDIAFPITERVNVAVFGLMRIILGIISLSVGVGVEAVQWAKIGRHLIIEKKVVQENVEVTHTPQPEQPEPTEQSEQTEPTQSQSQT